MAKITVYEDCGNAPKKLFLKNFIVSVVEGDHDFIASNTTDDILWDRIGDERISGKLDVIAELQRLRNNDVTELIVYTIVTHGYFGATNGLLKFKDGKTVAFCDVYQFNASTNNAPIKEIKTYARDVS